MGLREVTQLRRVWEQLAEHLSFRLALFCFPTLWLSDSFLSQRSSVCSTGRKGNYLLANH